MPRTAMLIPPTLDEIKVRALEIGLPEREAEKFFHYYESNGWKVGKNRMQSYTHALAYWKLVWQDQQEQREPDYFKGL